MHKVVEQGLYSERREAAADQAHTRDEEEEEEKLKSVRFKIGKTL